MSLRSTSHSSQTKVDRFDQSTRNPPLQLFAFSFLLEAVHPLALGVRGHQPTTLTAAAAQKNRLQICSLSQQPRSNVRVKSLLFCTAVIRQGSYARVGFRRRSLGSSHICVARGTTPPRKASTHHPDLLVCLARGQQCDWRNTNHGIARC